MRKPLLPYLYRHLSWDARSKTTKVRREPLKRLLYLAILSIAALLICAPAVSAQDKTVSIQDFSFSPGQITVAPGTTVTWVNKGPSPHTTTADDGSWDSGTLQQGEDFSFTFDQPGTYTYHCSIHPDMTATVKVSGSGGGGGATSSASASMSASMSPSASASASAPQKLTETGGISLPLVAAVALLGGGIVAMVAMRRAS
jgi:plastocyanin